MTDNYIYIISNSTAFKIGFSANPECRLKQLSTGNDQQLTLEWCMQRADACQLEKHLHRTFTKHKLRGEWFDNTTLQLSTIIAACYNYTKYDW